MPLVLAKANLVSMISITMGIRIITKCGMISIVAKFVYNKDKDSVLKAARAKLIHKPFKIYQQYPQEISERRRVLVPTMKELRDQNRRAYIV
jgi:hypothetical protein